MLPISLPLSPIILWLPVENSLENCLVFSRHSQQFSLPLFPVQTVNENGNKATQLLTCWMWQNSGFFCDDLLEDNVSIRKTNKIGHHCQIQISIKELSCIFFLMKIQ